VKTHDQCACAALMIRPASFGYNPETAKTNKMQSNQDGVGSNDRARTEFESLVQALTSEGVQICVVDDTPQPPKPDAIFPNNWVSFSQDGTVVLYPMQAESRRRERRREIVDQVAQNTGYVVKKVIDLSHYEAQGLFLEGTGSLVIDHHNRVAYGNHSPRTHATVVEDWAQQTGYRPVMFQALDRSGTPFYHANVMMCVGERFVVVGTGTMPAADRERVLAELQSTQREVIEIGHPEIERFGGNILELATWDEALGDSRVVVMSTTARAAFSPEALAKINASTDSLVAVPIPTIERLGGGGVRCMIAEVFTSSS
jgi:hypothetical protein